MRRRSRRDGVEILVTGGSGVLGRQLVLLLLEDGHVVRAPSRSELDLLDPEAVRRAVGGARAVYHLATRIPPASRAAHREAWRENDRLRATASRLLVDAALEAGAETFVLPSVAWLELLEANPPAILESLLVAEQEVRRLAAAGRRGVVLRLGLLDGPGTGNEAPDHRFGVTLHVADAGRALAAALGAPSGTYAAVRDGERVANAAYAAAVGWRALR